MARKLVVITATAVTIAVAGFLFRPVSYFNAAVYAADWASGVRNHAIQVDGYRVHYEAEGPESGHAVVLVHGLGGRAEDWRSLAPLLAKAGYRVYLPDLVGYGRSQKPADFSYSVRDEAQLVTDFLDAMKLDQVDLGGWSMGGAIVQHVAFDHPDRVRRLMLFDAAGIWQLPTWDVRLFTPTTMAELKQLDVLLMPKPAPIPAFLGNDILRVSNGRAWIIHRALASMMTGQDATDKLLPALKMPMLIVWGADDHITPLVQGEVMHRLVAQSELDVFPGCGHLAPGQCADQIAPKVVGFLQK